MYFLREKEGGVCVCVVFVYLFLSFLIFQRVWRENNSGTRGRKRVEEKVGGKGNGGLADQLKRDKGSSNVSTHQTKKHPVERERESKYSHYSSVSKEREIVCARSQNKKR